jgi:lipid II:glycine glycyltransferase (peptidoglycan interpeptide bridge formation enzyme)
VETRLSRISVFHTLEVGLHSSEEALLDNINGKTRYEIRRAAADSLEYSGFVKCAECELNRFVGFYDMFARHKALPSANRAKLNALAAAGQLAMTRISTRDGSDLVWHAYVCVAGRARLLSSASLFRLSTDASQRYLVGRANRLCHWRDMLLFRSAGFSWYDFGGWYAGSESAEQLRINAFKQEFVGARAVSYNCFVPMTLIGRSAVRAFVTAERARAVLVRLGLTREVGKAVGGNSPRPVGDEDRSELREVS